MSCVQGEGVQVVNIDSTRKYELNESALNKILLNDQIRSLPVVVVSVAGAFRGGKSFILDFFLRYLNATDTNRNNGQWLGKDDDPLMGFSWRTGVDRNTIGIHLWSSPHILTLPSGAKVAIVLMDTQGTFDDESTMRECTTIFALSTLISSVQIYNISQNLKEDDLQHLELFTGYAKLVLNEVGKPFQNLTFLIRDWNIPSDYAFGYQGGKSLLKKKLQVDKDKPAELQDIRQHIHSCFEEIDCFLMEHPGFAVRDKTFKGKLSELRPEFKTNLLELVPTLFASQNLRPKTSNKQTLTAGDLASHFKIYIDMFNSDDLPTPSTILKATAKASLMMATEAARVKYSQGMGAAGEGHSGQALPSAALYRLHTDAVAAARQHLAAAKTLAERREIDLVISQLSEEFESKLREIELVNDMKIKKALDNALKAYDQELLKGGNELETCIDPELLEKAHKRAVDAACAVLDQSRAKLEGYEDKETPILIKDLNERYRQICYFNESNNEKAVSEALEHFNKSINRECNGGNPCMSQTKLREICDRYRQEAINAIKNKRPKDFDKFKTKFIANLDKIINEQLNRLSQINTINNESVQISAVSFYKEKINNIFGPHNKCLSVLQFKEEEEKIQKDAITFFQSKRTLGEMDTNNDNIKHVIYEELKKYCNVVHGKNENMNTSAISGAVDIYNKVMKVKTKGFPVILAPISFILMPFRIMQLLLELSNYNREAHSQATDYFKNCRVNGYIGSESTDSHYRDLLRKLSSAHDEYRNPMVVIAQDLGFNPT